MNHRAVIYVGGGGFEAATVPTQEPPAGHVQMEVAYTGICGTDLKIAHGEMDGRFAAPWPIGHEMSGTIVEVGASVDGWHRGDKVTVLPLDWCDDCPACRAGHRHICHNLNFVGIDSPGSLQQRWNVRTDLLVRIPEGMALREAALVEPVAVAVHDVRRAGLASADRVVVIGAGPIGLLIAIVARHAGASVLVSEIAGSRRELAAGLGFPIVDPSQEALRERVRSWTHGEGADVAFEVSGSSAGVLEMSDVLAARGRGVVVAIHGTPAPVDLFQVFWKELQIVGARVYEREDFDEAIDLLTAGAIPVDRLITEVVPLDDAVSAIERLAAGGDVMKILVDCR